MHMCAYMHAREGFIPETMVTQNLLVYYLLDFHEVELWIAVKPEGHLHNKEGIMNIYNYQMLLALATETHF